MTEEPPKKILVILDSVTRKSVESTLMKSGNTLVKRSSVSGSSVGMKI